MKVKPPKTKKRLCYAAFLILAFFLIATVIFVARLRFLRYTPSVYTESAMPLQNPYIGWYQIYGYRLSDAGPFDPSPIEALEYGPGLAMLEINLQNYRDTPVSDVALDQLDSILAAWQSRGRQLILRFLYDWDGSALEKEPGDISLILRHMSQTAEIVNRHTDCVYILQGVFVGAWGEMHGSNYMGEDDLLTLAGHLDAVTDPSVFLAVRTPEQWRVVTRSHTPLTASQAFDGSLPARLGLFNDGLLGSDTDLGTYGTLETLDTTQFYGKLTRQAELDFQNTLCSCLPNGGEVVIDNPCNDFPAAASVLSYIHVSYLNRDYDEKVLNKWRESFYRGSGPFDGMNGYDYIGRHLGYRYVLRSSTLRSPLPWKETALLSLLMENVAFASSYRRFEVTLTLRSAENGASYLLPVQTDTRFWKAGEETQLDIPLNIRIYEPGSYELFLKISDPVSGFDIFLANEGAQNPRGLFLGILEIDEFPDL